MYKRKYWGSTFRAFFKNKFAVALLIALVVVVAFACSQPHLPGQADPNLCAVDPVTGIQYRNIAPGQDGFISVSDTHLDVYKRQELDNAILDQNADHDMNALRERLRRSKMTMELYCMAGQTTPDEVRALSLIHISPKL